MLIKKTKSNVIKTNTVILLRIFIIVCSIILGDAVDEERKYFSIKKISTSGCCSTFASFFANFSLMLLIKGLLI